MFCSTKAPEFCFLQGLSGEKVQIETACVECAKEPKMRKMTFFFGAENPLSNWHPASFVVNNVRFLNNEQFMMYCKAKLFGDEEIAFRIINATTPREQKALGRQVRGFDEAKWDEKRELYVQKGCQAKFSQNPEMLKFLLETVGTELVEASPYDRIWGVGLAANNPLIYDKSKWLGLNLLGKCLMEVRARLLEQQSQLQVSNIKDQKSVGSKGLFSGRVVSVANGVVSQRVNLAGQTVQHALSDLSEPVAVGAVVDIAYVDGVGVVAGKAGPDKGNGR